MSLTVDEPVVARRGDALNPLIFPLPFAVAFFDENMHLQQHTYIDIWRFDTFCWVVLK
jgi:hypothetical protein